MRAAVLAIAALALAAPASSGHCSAPWNALDATDVEVAGVYFVMDSCEPECGPGMNWWIYEESNGEPGLQRDDEIEDTTCHGMVEPDTLHF